MDTSPGKESTQLYIGNLPKDVVDNDLRQILSTYGKIKYLNLFRNSGNFPYAFCNYTTKSEAETAMKHLTQPPLKFKVNYKQKSVKSAKENYSPKDKQPANFTNLYYVDNATVNKSASCGKVNGSVSTCSLNFNKSTKSVQSQITTQSKSNKNEVNDNMTQAEIANKLIQDMMKIEKSEPDIIQSLMEVAKFIPHFTQFFNDIKENKKSLECMIPKMSEVKIDESVPKKSLEKKLFSAQATKEDQLKMVLQYELSKNRWLSVVITSETSQMYTSLLGEFADCCAHSPDCNAKLEAFEYEMAAVEFEKEWYRAYILPNKSWALIDDGRIVKPSDVSKVIKCPAKYLDAPAFCCILRYDKSFDRLSSKHMKCNVLLRDIESNVVFVTIMIDGQEVRAVLGLWDPIAEYHKALNEPEVVIESKSDKKYSCRLVLTNKDKVKLVNFVDFDNTFLRLADIKSDRAYVMQISKIYDAGAAAPKLKMAPEKGDYVLCKEINDEDEYYRAVVLKSNPDINVFQVAYLEYGRTVEKGLESLLECSAEIKNLPNLVTKVKLEGLEGKKPTIKVLEYFDGFIESQMCFECTFNGVNHHNVGVHLQYNGKSVNSKAKCLITPITDEVIDQPVFYANSIDTISFDKMDVSVLSPQLIITDTSDLKDKNTLICKLNDQKLHQKFTALMMEINSYCKSQMDHYLPRIDELCLALCDSDKLYYRGVVLDYITDEQDKHALIEDNKEVLVLDNHLKKVLVLFIDTGIREEVDMKNIRKILQDFVLSIPQLVNPCYLIGCPDNMEPEMYQKIVECLKSQRNMINVKSIKRDKNIYHIRVPTLLSCLK